MITSLNDFQRYCLKQNITFVSYVMPGEKNPTTIWCNEECGLTFKSISEITEDSGFLFSPFQAESCPVIVIPDHEKRTGWEFTIDSYPLSDHKKGACSGIEDLYITSYEEYQNQIEEIRKTLNQGKARKVVLSRIKKMNDFDVHLLPEVFHEMASFYSHAFVYLIYTPESGIWMGATPEILLQTDKLTFSTMALAGTKAFLPQKDIEWTEKEMKEQEYVVTHVRQRLAKGGYTFNESARHTVQAGNVVHLRTLFNGVLINDQQEWKNLVNLLYPTPAICGTDAETTLHVIQQAEKHKREYYTGIIGPFEAGSGTNLFINLRCMKVVENSALLFAGGGILGESSAEKEWEETELKFNTLIQVLGKVLVGVDKV